MNISQSTYVIASGAVVATGLVTYLLSKPSHNNINTFPGPPSSFLLGNIKQFPKDDWLQRFNEWRAEYGDIVYIELPQMQLLILSSLEDAEELLVRRSNIWSGRRNSCMVNEFMGFGWSLTRQQPGHTFNEARRIFRKVIGPQSVSDYDGLMELEAANFVQRLSNFLGDPQAIIQSSVGAIIVKMNYGEKIYQSHGSELVDLNTNTMELVTWALGAVWLVNLVPIARYLPPWLPGLQYPEYARRGKQQISSIRNRGFDLVKEDHDRGIADFSVVSKHLNDSDVDADLLRDSSSVMYFGGVDTTTAALAIFFSLMVMHPEVQKRIQQELDEVVGRGNTPTLAAVQSMQYLNAAWKESMRLYPSVPTGVPHTASHDDVWKDRLIPKGTTVIWNAEFMLRDPRLWGVDADDFKPERFILKYNPRASDLPDVGSIPFGFGRRICPGKYLADRNATIFIAAVLAAYDIVPPEGSPVPTTIEFTKGQIRRPENFQCRFVPRN